MIRVFVSLLLLSGFIPGLQAQILPEKMAAGQVPKTIKFRGQLVEAWKWKDRLGNNILLTSKLQPYQEKSPDENSEITYSAELHAFHFIKNDSGYRLLWKISDSEKNCPFDITVEFIKGAINISDLDNDGIAETTVQYKLACRSDVSPSQMKLIMHEDSVKYALRGTMWLKSSEDDKITVTPENVNLETWKGYNGTDDEWEKLFGRYQSEKEFANAPVAFLNFAAGNGSTI